MTVTCPKKVGTEAGKKWESCRMLKNLKHYTDK